MVFFKLCGRAGRSGLSARAHLFFPNQKKEYKDKGLREYVECGENCRRRVLLHGMGGDFVSKNGAEMCCDVCTPTVFTRYFATRSFIPCTSTQGYTEKRFKVEIVEWKGAHYEYPGLQIFGKDFIFPDSTISLLCKEAEYIQTISDLSFYGISRLDIQARLFNIIIYLVADAPPQKRRRKK